MIGVKLQALASDLRPINAPSLGFPVQAADNRMQKVMQLLHVHHGRSRTAECAAAKVCLEPWSEMFNIEMPSEKHMGSFPGFGKVRQGPGSRSF